MIHTYTISGMTCNSCVARVKSELLKLGDITDANVQLAAPQATLTMNKHIPTGKLQEAVFKAGHYTIADDPNSAIGASTSMHHRSTFDQATDNQNPTVQLEQGGSYYPIFLIFGFITGITLLIQLVSGSFVPGHWMSHFMAGFFLVFSFFKLLDLKGFAEGYRTYDIIAKVFPVWGFIYPFVELILGLLFLTGLYSAVTNVVTFVVMGVSSIGVIQSLLKKTRFQCACLGTIFKVPLSKVTLTEDLLMVTMSGIMIVMMII